MVKYMNFPPLITEDRCILEDFDMNDPANLGRPLYWNLRNHIIAIEQMICADEIEIAFQMLDQIPAWYRENYPPQLAKLKAMLYTNLYDNFDYASDNDEAGWSKEDAEKQFLTPYTYPRGEILRDLCLAVGASYGAPWVCELSTSHGLLPLGLQREGIDFNFFGKNLNHAALVKLKSWLKDGVWADQPKPNQKTIFVFTEALEHSYREEDLKNSYYKLGIDFDYLILSVPYGCLGHGLPNWKTRRLGHLRGYTKQEFYDLAVSFFPGYNWQLTVSQSLVLVGRKHVEKELPQE